MCLTIPGKILAIKNNFAKVQLPHEVRQINISALSDDLKNGDWLLNTVDLAVKKIDQNEAKEILELLEGRKLLSLDKEINPKIKKIISFASTRTLTETEILTLLKTKGKEKEALFSEADIVRKTYVKDFICLHGVIEFSNYCQNNCFYCGLRRDNKKFKRYRMSINEIIKIADRACSKIGYKMLILQSGVDFGYSDNDLIKLVKKIKSRCRCFLFVSVGERSLRCYKKMKSAGADGVLLRFETSNKKLYKRLHNINSRPKTQNFKLILSDRITLIKNLKKIGYYIASGFLVGLPGQNFEDIASDILMTKNLGTQMLSFGPFVPCSNTPFATENPGDMDLVYKIIATMRLLMKGARIPITTAMETLDKKARKTGFVCGANSLMLNLTPKRYAEDYKIYSGKIYSRDKKLENLALFSGEESWKMLEREFKQKSK
jgi:biotin synthase